MRFPNQLRNRAAATIATTADLLNNAHQRLNVIGSQVSSLTPGDWTDITLAAGWSNLAGYIPAQARIMQAGMAQIVGHIEGGTTANGTIIGTLAAGYYNTAYQHSFTANVMSGAAAVSVAGTISGSTDSNALTNGGISGATTSNADTDGSTQGTSGSTTATSGVAHTHSAGTYGTTNTFHVHSASSMAVINSFHTHTNTSGNQAAATPVNYNTVTLTLTTGGELVLSSCPAAATQISFNENLPLMGT